MVEINWTKQALCDLESIYRFIAKDSKSFANYHINKLRSKVKVLKDFPEIGRIVPEIKQN
jgi:toxin ParE1/3/4